MLGGNALLLLLPAPGRALKLPIPLLLLPVAVLAAMAAAALIEAAVLMENLRACSGNRLAGMLGNWLGSDWPAVHASSSIGQREHGKDGGVNAVRKPIHSKQTPTVPCVVESAELFALLAPNPTPATVRSKISICK